MPDLKHLPKLMRESTWIILGQITAMLGSFAMIRVCTDNLTPGQYGELAIGMTAAMVINQVVSGGICGSIGRYYSIACEKNQIGAYLAGSVWLLSLSIGVTILVFLLVIVALMLSGYHKWIAFALIMGGLCIITALNSTMSGIQNAARQRAIVALHDGMDAWLKVGLALSLFVILERSSEVAAASYVVAAILVSGSQVYFLNKLLPLSEIKWKTSSVKKWSPLMWQQAWPISFWGIFTAFQLGSDRWALGHFGTLHDVGSYAVLFQIGFVPISLVGGVVIGLIGPIMFQQAGDASELDRINVVHKATKFIAFGMLGVSFSVASVAYFFHEIVFRFLVNDSYGDYSYLLPLMILAGGFQSCHQIIGVRVSSGLQVRKIMLPQIISAILFCFLNVSGAYLGGITGLVWAFLIASLLYMFWIIVVSEVIKNKKFKLAIKELSV